MVTTLRTLRAEDRLDGAMNFRSWKIRINNILEENDLDDYVKNEIVAPTDDAGKATYKKNLAKEKGILIDSVKDHLLPHISQKKTTKEIYDSLTSLFETKNPSRKRALQSQLRNLKMTKDDTITPFS
jgi:hypothetical protein